jgi:hypothetical protein
MESSKFPSIYNRNQSYNIITGQPIRTIQRNTQEFPSFNKMMNDSLSNKSKKSEITTSLSILLF